MHAAEKAIWIFIVLVVAPSSISAQTPNPTLTDLPDGQWSVLPKSAITSAGDQSIACCDFEIGCELSGVFSYSGATLDPDRRQIVLWGGGHNDYFGNQLLTFDLHTLSWNLATSPTSVCLLSDPPDYRFTNGLPVSRHTYDHIGYVGHLGVFFSYSGATADAPPFNGGDSYGDLWTFDFGTGLWTDHTAGQSGDIDFQLAQPGASGEYDGVTRKWYQISQYGVWSLDFDTLVWTQVHESGHPGIERTSVLDPVRRLIWSYGGDYGGDQNLTAYDLDANELQMVSTENLPGITSGAGLAYDGANDHLVVYGGYADASQRSVFNYDIQTGQWTEFPFVSGPSATGERTYGRFLYDPINNVFFLIESIHEVWVWKNTLGSDVTIFRDGFESGDLALWSSN